GCTALALAVAGLGYSVLFLTPLYDQLGAILKAKNYYHPVGDTLDHFWTYFNQNKGGFRQALIGYFTWPLIAAGLLGAAVAWRARARLTALLLLWVIVPLIAAFVIA